MIDYSPFKKLPVFYISPDIKRALGPELILPNYHIICSYKQELVSYVRKKGGNVFCLEEEIGEKAESFINTSQLLSHPGVSSYIEKMSNGQVANILYFKPNLKADQICKEKDYKKLVNDYEFNEEFENKIRFYEIIRNILPQHTIPAIIGKLEELHHTSVKQNLGNKLVIQFGHGWAGKTTFIIETEQEFKKLQNKYPFTTAKIARHIRGSTYLNNCCIYDGKVLVGQPAIQLSGIKELSKRQSQTCGRQWPNLLLAKAQETKIKDISQNIGKNMIARGYKGIFGLDFLISKENGDIFITENNARFTASIPFYTKLEIEKKSVPLMIYHIAAFLNLDVQAPYMSPDIRGTQFIARNDTNKDYIVKKDYITGIYELKDGKLQFIKKEYDINETKNNQFILFSEKKGSKIKKDDEIARIETKDAVLEEGRSLNHPYQQIIHELKSSLNL